MQRNNRYAIDSNVPQGPYKPTPPPMYPPPPSVVGYSNQLRPAQINPWDTITTEPRTSHFQLFNVPDDSNASEVFDPSTTNETIDRAYNTWSYECNGCKTMIKGIRYNCLVCVDFDLCGNCNSAGVHSHHNMVKIVNPNETRPFVFPWTKVAARMDKSNNNDYPSKRHSKRASVKRDTIFDQCYDGSCNDY
ncbi:hypothetical protein ACOME3_003235 [Neoechinorhynchus agilis]